MTSPMLTCEMFDVLLSDYLEGTLDDVKRSAAEMHVERCDRCSALVRDVRHIAYDAGALPDLTPERDLWSGIEARLEPEVVPIASYESHAMHASHAPARTRRFVPRVTMGWLAAAALLLMAATAGVTYEVTTHRLAASPIGIAQTGSGGRTVTGAPGTPSNIQAVANSPVEATYDREIAELRASVEARRSELDPATVAIIERNLRVIDTAIAQSRAALAADPASQFLHDQLNIALGQKVALLRRAALLPSHT